MRRSLGILLALVVGACGSSPPEPAESPAPHAVKSPAESPHAGVPALAASTLTTLEAEAFGPYVGIRPGAQVAVWAATSKKGSTWYSRVLEGSGEPLRLGATSGPLDLVAVRPAGGGGAAERNGFIVLSTRQGARSAVEAMLLGRQGQLVGGPVALTETASAILWVEALPTSRGTLTLWAVEHQGKADLWAMLVGPDASLEGEPRVVVRGALAWQAVAAPGGAMVGVVQLNGKANGTGTVELVSLDGTGAAVGKPIVVSGRPTAQADLDMARIGDRIVLAWTDRRTLDPRVTVAMVAGSGALVAKPEPVLPPRGEQSLVRVVAPAAGQNTGYLAWENLPEQTTEGRRILLCPIDDDGQVGSRRGEIVITHAEGGVPELVATSRGLAALTLAPACPQSGCRSSEALPTFVELSSDFTTLASEPIRLDSLGRAPVPLAWGLSCFDQACVALAAKNSLPTPVYAVKLASRSSHWTPAGGPLRVPSPPRLDALRTLARGDELADVAALAGEKGTLVASVTYFDPNVPYKRLTKPGPDGRYDPPRALLQTRVVTPDGSAADPQTISIRARCLGGVGLAPAPNHGALLVWSAIDRTDPQVFLTLLNVRGGRVLQRMLTRGPGEVTDVAVAEVEGGWIVGWISARDGDPEVYVARIDRALRRVGKEQRVTNAAGTATGLRLVSQGESVLAAWSDARGPKGTSLADVFTVRISAKDASLIGSEVRVAETRWDSHSPALVMCDDTAVLGWVESTGMETTSPNKGTGVRLVELDSAGQPRGNILLDDGQNVTSGLSLDCHNGLRRGVYAVRTAGGRELRGFDWSSGRDGALRAVRLAGLRGPTEQPLPTALAGERLLYGEVAESRGQLMMMDLVWE